jgi:hypothetical protein
VITPGWFLFVGFPDHVRHGLVGGDERDDVRGVGRDDVEHVGFVGVEHPLDGGAQVFS